MIIHGKPNTDGGGNNVSGIDDKVKEYADRVVHDAEAWLEGIAADLRPVAERALRMVAEASIRGVANPSDDAWKRDIKHAKSLLASQQALLALDASRKVNSIVSDSLRFGIQTVIGVLA